MTGTFHKHLSLIDTCHYVGTVQLYKYWPLVRVLQAASKYDTRRIANVYVAYLVETCL
jgi:hypothetical protein